MSYRFERKPLTKERPWLMGLSILLMVPVLLDGAGLISLGEWRLAPFLILLITAGAFTRRGSARE